MSAGLQLGKLQNRPSGLPPAGRRADFDVSPIRIRPKSAPEGRLPALKHYCITSGTTPWIDFKISMVCELLHWWPLLVVVAQCIARVLLVQKHARPSVGTFHV